MNKTKKNLNIYFEELNSFQDEFYSTSIIKSLTRSILEPIAELSGKAIVLCRLKNVEGIESLIKRLEYSSDVHIKEFSDFEFSRFDVAETGFIVLNTQRMSCAFLFREIEQDKYKIYFKINSKLVFNVYETLKSVFDINFDEEFYEFKPERRENELINKTVENIIKHFQETIIENEYSTKIQENYRTANEANTVFRNEIYQNVRQIAHEIKNQISIMDIYTRIFEKKTGDRETVEPIKKSIELIKSQIEQFKNIDVINLQIKDVKSIIRNSIKMYSPLLKEKNNKTVLIDEMAEVDAKAFVDEDKLLMVVNNVIKNAHDSTSNDEIVIKISKVEDKVKISFTNHGEMIEKRNQDKIFETGYTTKKEGWGVGLSVCKKYIGSQFGTFELTKSDEKETVFSIILKLAQN